jgi:2-iminobutanoate/2-iminopropanoate deaminase
LGSEILLLARGHHGGRKTIWLAGHVGFVDDSGASLAGNFDAQTRQAFKNLEKTLQRAGGTLKDIVWMTVSVSDGTLVAALHRYS